MKRYWAYLKYVCRHKWFVFWACLKLGVPLWIALWHDWDKFLPKSWLAYAKTFYNKDGSKRYQEFPEFAVAWLHHQHWSKHHWQYWMLTWDRGETECLPMPDVYRREMLADWIGAGQALDKPNTWEWYAANKDKLKLHPDTRQWIEVEIESIHVAHSEMRSA